MNGEKKGRKEPVQENGEAEGAAVKVCRVEFQPFPGETAAPPGRDRSPVFNGIRLKLAAELGKTRIKIRDFINLEEGSLLELNRPADENVTLLANGAPFARGEIVVINERFGVRLTSFMHEKRE